LHEAGQPRVGRHGGVQQRSPREGDGQLVGETSEGTGKGQGIGRDEDGVPQAGAGGAAGGVGHGGRACIQPDHERAGIDGGPG
jgi:hypothetical protein